MMNAPDQVIFLKDGFYAFVEGKLHGPWPMKEYALAGLATEQRRAQKRKENQCRTLQ